MALRRITLQQLFRMAKKDRRFFNALFKNPRTSIAKKGRVLSPGDLRRLEKANRKVYKISGKRLAEIILKGMTSRPPWP